MILNKIQLTNIGAYKGINKIDFSPNDNQNVVLIGGENGAGKTTLLNAIKLGLFGSYGYGYKSESTGYYKKVTSILNQQAKKNNENNFRIVIEFSLIEGFEKSNYKLYRFWKFTNTSLKESLDIISNGKQLSEYEKELFQTKLKEVMPPQLLDLCLFDGEEISRIVNEDLLSSYLKNLSRVVFNLDLFETLESDLESYSKQTLDVKKMEINEQELYRLNKAERELRDQLIKTTEQHKVLLNDKSDFEDEYVRLKNDFEKYGGLKKAERDEMIKVIHELESSRKQNFDKIKDFVSTLLPFYLSKNLLEKTRVQIQDEESLQLYKQLETRLNDHNLSTVLKNINGSTNEQTSKELKEQLLSIMMPKDNVLQIHGASFSESSLIENMYLQSIGNHDQTCLEVIGDNKTKLLELQSLKNKLKTNDTTNEFSEMIQEMETVQQKINILDSKIKETELTTEELRKELQVTFTAIDKIQSTLKDSDKTKSSFLESQKIISLSRRFREIQLKKKLQQVQFESSNMLKRILRKHNYVSSIHINPETYDVLLLDSNKETIEKATLSAGEKQILLLSIIWAIFKCSGRKVPFIFDTLLGRLDKTHKAAVIKEFIPNSGKQSIILSTDTEIDEAHYNILRKYVAKEYMLIFNVERKETNVINQYFPFKNEEVGI